MPKVVPGIFKFQIQNLQTVLEIKGYEYLLCPTFKFPFFSIQTSAKNDAARNALNYLKIMTKKPPAAAAAKDVDIEAKSKDHPTRSHNGASKKLI